MRIEIHNDHWGAMLTIRVNARELAIYKMRSRCTCTHGPQRWPRIGWQVVTCSPTIKRLWLYAFGYAWHFDYENSK